MKTRDLLKNKANDTLAKRMYEYTSYTSVY